MMSKFSLDELWTPIENRRVRDLVGTSTPHGSDEDIRRNRAA